MTRIIISLIVAIIFIVVSLSQTIIPCEKPFDFCILDGQQNYFYTEKLSDSIYAGILSFAIVFLIVFLFTYLVIPKKVIRYQ